MAKIFTNQNEYNIFLYKVQKPKMKELWNNIEDETWENIYS